MNKKKVSIKRRCRKLSAYNLFFKEKYSSVKNLPNKERVKAIAKMWRDR